MWHERQRTDNKTVRDRRSNTKCEELSLRTTWKNNQVWWDQGEGQHTKTRGLIYKNCLHTESWQKSFSMLMSGCIKQTFLLLLSRWQHFYTIIWMDMKYAQSDEDNRINNGSISLSRRPCKLCNSESLLTLLSILGAQGITHKWRLAHEPIPSTESYWS